MTLAASVITNFNQFLTPFSTCLIHLINYEGIDFDGFSHPVVLSRYDVLSETVIRKKPRTKPFQNGINKNGTNQFNKSINTGDETLTFYDETVQIVYEIVPIEESRTGQPIFSNHGTIEGYPYIVRSSTYNWQCFVQFYILPPKNQTSPFNSDRLNILRIP